MALKAFLTRLIWLCMWPLLALAAYLAVSDVLDIQRRRDVQANSLAKALAAAIDQALDARIGALQMLTSSPLADAPSDRASLYREALGFRQSFGGHVILADLDTQMLFNTRLPFGEPLPKLPRPSTRAAVPIAIQTGQPAVGDAFQGMVDQQQLVAVAVPVKRQGQVVAVLLSTFESAQLQKQLDHFAAPPAWALALLDSSGAVVANRAASASSGGDEVEDRGRFVVPLSRAPWSVVLSIPRGAYYAPTLRAAGVLTLAILAATAAGLIGATLAGRRLSRSLAALALPGQGAQLTQAPDIAEIAAVAGLLREAHDKRSGIEATLSQSEQRFRRMFQESPLPLALISKEGMFLDLNIRFIAVFGYQLDELRTMDDWMQRAYPDRGYRNQLTRTWATTQAKAAAAALAIEPLERRIRCKDGTMRDMVVSSILIDGEFLSSFFEVTGHKLALARLQEQLDRLNLLDQITTAIGERQDLGSIYQVVLRRLEERLPVAFSCMLGLDEATGRLTVLRLGPGSAQQAWQLGLAEQQTVQFDPEDLARCMRGEIIHEPETADRQKTSFPLSWRLADGGLRSLVVAPLRSDKGMVGALVVARATPSAFSSGECEFLRQLCAHVGLASQQAQMHEALQKAYDELRLTQQAVMQQERLRALGQMASGVAHDINNAISPVLLYTETLLENEPGLSPRARNYLQTIARSIDDVAATVARLREFYRQREMELTLVRVDLPPLIEQVMELTRARWHDMPLQRGVVIRATTDLAADLPAVMGIESELREALINLIFNAIDAMPEGGSLSVSAQPAPGAAAVELRVADTGMGMDEDTRRRCLEPFFTTKGERGTGLGLAMVYGVMQRHNADLSIESTPGQGTTVLLSLPLPPETQAAEIIVATELVLRPLRLLVVDDDPIVLTSLRETLQADGHAVVTADGGQAGIDRFAESIATGPAFDAVITDLGMPYVDGRQLAQAVKARSATTPVILVTGWGQRLITNGEVPPDVDGVLSKPPKLRQLRTMLAELVDRHKGTEG